MTQVMKQSVDCSTDGCVCPQHANVGNEKYAAAFTDYLPAMDVACQNGWHFDLVCDGTSDPHLELGEGLVYKVGDEWLASG